LPRAAFSSIERTRRSRRAGNKIADFERRYEEGMPKFREAAAASAQVAHRTEQGYLPVNLIVDAAELAFEAGLGPRDFASGRE
jgi:hypothetical protein